MNIKQIKTNLQLKLQIIQSHIETFTGTLIALKTRLQSHPAYNYLVLKPIDWIYVSRKRPVKIYLNKFVNTTIEAALLVIIICLLSYILLFLFEKMWYLYLSTPMGYKFLQSFPERAQTIIEITDLDLLYFAVDLTLSIFVLCIVLSSICRFFHINYFFYHSCGFFGKLLFWGIPITAMASYYIKYRYEFTEWEVTCVVVAFPAYLMFISCFSYTEKLLPELGDIIRLIIPPVKKSYTFVLLKVKELIGIEPDINPDSQEDTYGM
jgi:hypothetical protein